MVTNLWFRMSSQCKLSDQWNFWIEWRSRRSCIIYDPHWKQTSWLQLNDHWLIIDDVLFQSIILGDIDFYSFRSMTINEWFCLIVYFELYDRIVSTNRCFRNFQFRIVPPNHDRITHGRVTLDRVTRTFSKCWYRKCWHFRNTCFVYQK